MQSFIIFSKEDEDAEKEWQKLCEKNSIDQFDQTIIESEDQLGIEAIREIQKNIFLFPAKGKTKGILVKNSNTLTLPAQNAFLKLLEEPPNHAIIVLQTDNIDALLPTIQSRCFLITASAPQISQTLEQPQIESLTMAKRLELAEEIAKSKESALTFLQKEIFSERNKLLENPGKETAERINQLQKAYAIINTTNVNPRFTLENLFLGV